ncbi:hypothetical protein [Allofournierella massiliensis]|uniref:Uncharacterized protein n=1 Tax=Allofournierella massiliensis TaxID=1650663 RepID=A0A4R1QQH7_9FIRM|nr:hypothetical protein [Fournierella massiliensis]TCL56066.1 hypothetical protein EDD77_11420 [Fournierella massiliensis]
MNNTDFEPMNPMEETAQPEMQADRPQGAPQPRRAQKMRQERPKVRRVGFFTLGIALILTGGCIAASMILPDFPLFTVAKLAPLVLVALGVEVLWANARKGDAQLKYDLLSMFVCFVLICASMGAATLPILLRYYGPDREYTERRLEQELEEHLNEKLPDGIVLDGYSYVDLNRMEFDREMTLADLKTEDLVRVNLTLAGAYADENAFAEACAQMLPALRELGVDQVDFHSENGDDQWELQIGGPFQMNASAQELAVQVTHMVRYWEDDSYTWWDEDELTEHLAEQENTDRQEPQPEADSTEITMEQAGETSAEVTAMENG